MIERLDIFDMQVDPSLYLPVPPPALHGVQNLARRPTATSNKCEIDLTTRTVVISGSDLDVATDVFHRVTPDSRNGERATLQVSVSARLTQALAAEGAQRYAELSYDAMQELCRVLRDAKHRTNQRIAIRNILIGHEILEQATVNLEPVAILNAIARARGTSHDQTSTDFYSTAHPVTPISAVCLIGEPLSSTQRAAFLREYRPAPPTRPRRQDRRRAVRRWPTVTARKLGLA